MEEVEIQQLTCKECGHTFFSYYELYKHDNRVHSSMRSYAGEKGEKAKGGRQAEGE